MAEVGGGGGGDAPDATDPFDDDGGRSEAAADASLESAKDRGIKVAPITLKERMIVMEELKGGDLRKGCDEQTTAVFCRRSLPESPFLNCSHDNELDRCKYCNCIIPRFEAPSGSQASW